MIKLFEEYIESINEQKQAPRELFFNADGSLNLNVVNGKVKFILSENLDYPEVYSTHNVLHGGLSITFRRPDESYIVIYSNNGKKDVLDLFKQAFGKAKKIDSEKATIPASWQQVGPAIGANNTKVNIQVDTYEINVDDINWNPFDKMRPDMWCSKYWDSYEIGHLGRKYAYEKLCK